MSHNLSIFKEHNNCRFSLWLYLHELRSCNNT